MSADTSARSGARPGDAAVPFRMAANVSVTQSAGTKHGAKRFFVRAAPGGEVYRFGEEELFVCQALDGATSFADIRAAFQARFGMDFPADRFREFLAHLVEIGVVERVDAPMDRPARRMGFRRTQHDAPFEPDGASSAPRPEGRPRRDPFRWKLFDPTPLLGVLARVFRPLGYLTWLLIPGALVAGLILFHRQVELSADLHRLATLSTAPTFILGLLVVNLTSRLAQGAVAHRFGAAIDDFGLALVFGFFPRFYIERRPIQQLDRRGRLWSYASPLLARLTVFVVGTFIWIGQRQSGTWLPDVALLVSQFAFVAFLFGATPLLRTDGYLWLVEYFEQPYLRERAMRLFGMRVKGEPPAAAGRSRWPLVLYGAAIVLFTGAFLVGVLLYIGVTLEARFQGTGVSLFLVIFTSFMVWLLIARLGAKRPPAAEAVDAAAATSDAVVPFARHLPAVRPGTAVDVPRGATIVLPDRRRARLRNRLAWAFFLAVIGIVSFIPYPYETGGNFTVLPANRIEVRARVDGEVLDVFIEEGDWVQADDILALLSDWDEMRDVAVTRAELDRAIAALRRLNDGPKPEEVELAKKQAASAAAKVTFARLEAERAQTLLQSATISLKAAERAETELDTALAELAVAEANLELVRSGATEAEIEAAEAEVRRLTEEMAYRQDQLERTRVRAPSGGRVVTPGVQLNRGAYLGLGGLFAELEDNRTALAEVEVPETDIGEVEVGAEVRLKPWGFSDRILVGQVVAIAPAAEERAYGRIVRVKTNIPNPDGTLKSNMTGYAKIEGPRMPVWKAFTRMIVRFFQVEFWSWIP